MPSLDACLGKGCDFRNDDTQQIVGRERRERVSQLARCGEGCFDARRRVNSDVGRLTLKWQLS